MLMQQVDSVVLNQVRKEYGLEESSSQEKTELEPKVAYDTKKILDTHHRKLSIHYLYLLRIVSIDCYA